MPTRTVEFNITPAEAAAAFASFFSNEQAEFFNALAAHIEQHYEQNLGSFCIQLHAVSIEPELLPAARQVMSIIGEYSQLPQE
jgi:hypothetical protein